MKAWASLAGSCLLERLYLRDVPSTASSSYSPTQQGGCAALEAYPFQQEAAEKLIHGELKRSWTLDAGAQPSLPATMEALVAFFVAAVLLAAMEFIRRKWMSLSGQEAEADSAAAAAGDCSDVLGEAADVAKDTSAEELPVAASSKGSKGGSGKGPPLIKGSGKGKGKSKGPPCGPGAKGKGRGGKAVGKGKGGAKGSSEDSQRPGGGGPLGRRIFMKPLKSVGGTVFEDLHSGGPLCQVAVQALNAVFHAPAKEIKPKSAAATRVSRSFVPKPSKQGILDNERAQQLAIVFRKSPIKIDKLCDALRSLNFKLRISEEDVDRLLKVWPTPHEVQRVKDFTGDVSELRDVERDVMQLGAVPRGEARLRAIVLAKGLRALHGEFQEQLVALQQACEDMLRSPRLRVVLGEALRLVNFINHGPVAEGGADSFTIDEMVMLRSMKGSGGATALHCLCITCAQAETLHQEDGQLPSKSLSSGKDTLNGSLLREGAAAPDFLAQLQQELCRVPIAAKKVNPEALKEVWSRLRQDVALVAKELEEPMRSFYMGKNDGGFDDVSDSESEKPPFSPSEKPPPPSPGNIVSPSRAPPETPVRSLTRRQTAVPPLKFDRTPFPPLSVTFESREQEQIELQESTEEESDIDSRLPSRRSPTVQSVAATRAPPQVIPRLNGELNSLQSLALGLSTPTSITSSPSMPSRRSLDTGRSVDAPRLLQASPAERPLSPEFSPRGHHDEDEARRRLLAVLEAANLSPRSKSESPLRQKAEVGRFPGRSRATTAESLGVLRTTQARSDDPAAAAEQLRSFVASAYGCVEQAAPVPSLQLGIVEAQTNSIEQQLELQRWLAGLPAHTPRGLFESPRVRDMSMSPREPKWDPGSPSALLEPPSMQPSVVTHLPPVSILGDGRSEEPQPAPRVIPCNISPAGLRPDVPGCASSWKPPSPTWRRANSKGLTSSQAAPFRAIESSITADHDQNSSSVNGSCGYLICQVPNSRTGTVDLSPMSSDICGTVPDDGDGDASSQDGHEQSGSLKKLEALVSRGHVLLRVVREELDAVLDTASRCERYFGGSGNSAMQLFVNVSEFVSAFRVAWEQVHRDDRWGRFLPNLPNEPLHSASTRAGGTTPGSGRSTNRERMPLSATRRRVSF
eukprot:TRINITY_DN19820_c0_g2_i1.p1 TRINITY_DN19820_c0_g2~~TRINITY_DN19820_c0_g2_i1.p1  ORF type:complete len:1140 (+),score=208.83 TRINITY_DN19820_c0_g2_i1:162-3581(+)